MESPGRRFISDRPAMLTYLSEFIAPYWGPARLLTSYTMLATVGALLSAILSLLVVVAATFVIILFDSWLGIALIAVAAVLYFVLSFLQIGASRRREAAQLAAFERKKRHRRRWR